MKTRIVLMVTACLGWAVYAQADQMVYNANDEFSLTSNPNGVWTYGAYDFVTVDNGTSLFDTPDNWSTRPDALVDLDTWRMAGTYSYDPSVTHNGTGGPVSVFGFTWQPNDIGLDSYGGASIIQWTAPRAGTVTANAVFSPSAADAYVGFNGAVVNSQSNVSGTTWEYTFAVNAGDHVAIAAAGPETVTIFHGTITYEVPEPATMGLLATGLIGLLCYAWRRRM